MIEVYNRPVIACVIKTAKEVSCLLFNHAKKVTHSGFLRSLSSYLSACAATNLATVVKDTHLTLTVILFNVRANNSLILFLLQTYEKKFAEFRFLFSLYFLDIAQGIIDSTGTETRQRCSHMIVMARSFEELFTPN